MAGDVDTNELTLKLHDEPYTDTEREGGERQERILGAQMEQMPGVSSRRAGAFLHLEAPVVTITE